MERFRELGAWVVAIMLAGAFLLTGGMKLIGAPDMVAAFQHWGYDQTFMYGIGVLEVAAAIAMLIPATAFFGALAIVVEMLGAMYTHFTMAEYGLLTVPLAMAAMAAWLAWARRPAFLGGHPERPGHPRAVHFASAMPDEHERRRR